MGKIKCAFCNEPCFSVTYHHCRDCHYALANDDSYKQGVWHGSLGGIFAGFIVGVLALAIFVAAVIS